MRKCRKCRFYLPDSAEVFSKSGVFTTFLVKSGAFLHISAKSGAFLLYKCGISTLFSKMAAFTHFLRKSGIYALFSKKCGNPALGKEDAPLLVRRNAPLLLEMPLFRTFSKKWPILPPKKCKITVFYEKWWDSVEVFCIFI